MNPERHGGMRIRYEIGLLTLLTVLIWGSLVAVGTTTATENAPLTTVSGAAAPARDRDAAVPLERLTGTVKAVDPRTHTVVILTGVGHALRVLRVVLPPELEVRRGSNSTVSRLTPGCIVRIECRRAAVGRVASTVTLLRPAPREAKP